MKKIGKKLDNILGDKRPSAPLTANFEIIFLPIDLLQASKHQPRKIFDEEKILELAESIKNDGLLQPIVIRKNLNSDKYEIIAGERRFRAATIAGLKEIPVIIREYDDKKANAVALIENIQRENLNPIEEAEAFQRLLKDYNLSHESIANEVGKKRTTITNALRLLDLDEQVKLLMLKNMISMGHARALLPLNPQEQIRIAKQVIDLDLSVRQTEKLIKQLTSELHSNKKYDFHTFTHKAKKIEKELSKFIASKVKVDISDKGRGKVTLYFNEIKAIEDFVSILKSGS